MSTVILIPTGIGNDDINCPHCGKGYQFDDICDFWGETGETREKECDKCGKTFKYKIVIKPEEHRAELVDDLFILDISSESPEYIKGKIIRKELVMVGEEIYDMDFAKSANLKITKELGRCKVATDKEE